MTREINTDKLVAKLGSNKKTFKSDLADILTAFDNQPKNSPGDLALQERKSRLAHCKKEVGTLLMRAQKNRQLTDEIAKKTIDQFDLCSLTKDKTPKKPSPYWLRRIVSQWIKEDAEKFV